MVKSNRVDSIFFWILYVFIIFLPSSLVFALDLQKPGIYQGDESIENWVMSEKLDGIRGYWNGKYLQTRQGKKIVAPAWFLLNFPPFALDGELWSGRSQFEFIQATVLDQKPSEDWKKITYNIFETPKATGSFYARLQKAEQWFSAHSNNHVRIIPQITCENSDHLNRFLKEIESLGGEGVIVKDPSQNYFTGRSPYVLKVKNFNDMEGVVVAINPGKGKFENMMGSLTVKLENGLIFKLGTGFSDEVRANPPDIGNMITFKHFGFTKSGIPKFASYLRIRKD